MPTLRWVLMLCFPSRSRAFDHDQMASGLWQASRNRAFGFFQLEISTLALEANTLALEINTLAMDVNLLANATMQKESQHDFVEYIQWRSDL